MIFSLASDIGKVRKNNEDFVDVKIITREDDDSKIGIFALADGMGGHNKGEVASAMAVKGIIEHLGDNLESQDIIKIDYLDDIIKKAYYDVNLNIYNKSIEDKSFSGMGTTLVTAIIYNDDMYVANVGDSRCYIFREGEIKRVTTDHSLVQDLVEMNIISEEEAMTHPIRNQITRAIGTSEIVAVDIFREKLQSGDKILLATDGLTGCVLDENIKKLMADEKEIELLSKDLIDYANETSGRDNVSVILIKKS